MKNKVIQGLSRLYQNRPLLFKTLLFLLFVILSLISTFLFPFEMQKEVDEEYIQAVFSEKELYAESVLRELKAELQDIEIIPSEFRGNIFDESEEQEVAFFVYRGDHLLFWTDHSLAISDILEVPIQEKFFFLADNASVVVIQSFYQEYRCMALIKIKERMLSDENDERNHYAKNFDLPGSVLVAPATEDFVITEDSFFVRSNDGTPLFLLKNIHYETESYARVLLTVFLWVVTLLLAFSLVYEKCKEWIEQKKVQSVEWSRKWNYLREGWINPNSGSENLKWRKILICKSLMSFILLWFVFLMCDVGVDSRVNVAVPFIQDISRKTILALMLVFVFSYLYYVVLKLVRKLYASRENVKKILVVQVFISLSVIIYLCITTLWLEAFLFFIGTLIVLFVDLYEIYYVPNLFLFTAPIALTFANLIVWTSYHYSLKKNEKFYRSLTYNISMVDCVYQDVFSEELLKSLSKVLEKDSTIKDMMSSPVVSDVRLLEYVNSNYIEYFTGKYDLHLQVCEPSDDLVLRMPSFDEKKYKKLDDLLKSDFRKIPSSFFYANEKEKQAVSYLGVVHYGERRLFYKFYRKAVYDQSSLWEQSLLASRRVYFSLAKYRDGQRNYSEGEYRYPISMTWLEEDKGQTDYVVYANSHTHYVHKYALGEKLSVVTVPEQNVNVCVILITYLFSAYLIIALLYFCIYFVWRSLLNRRKSIFSQMQLTFLTPMVIVFVLLIMMSVPFFKGQLLENCFSDLRGKSMIVQQFIQFLSAKSDLSEVSKEIASEVKKSANQFHLDILLYDKEGRLSFSSRPLFIAMDRRQPDLICPEMKFGNHQDFGMAEKVGDMNFYSLYTKAYNQKNEHIGYIHLLSQKAYEKVDGEMINLLSMVIDAYLIIAIFSLFFIWILYKRSTRPLQLLSDRFTQIRLSSRNTLVEYPYDDEFGDLVENYNKMVLQLEDSAEKLARSEREFAWREMARRIAHEIKNPLTPMKLSIQQCVRKRMSDPEHFPEHFEKSAEVLIEQIDNLANIASEFSSFAKAAEARPKWMDIIPKIRSSVELFGNNTQDVAFSLHLNGHESAFVCMDERQLLQVLNNLFRNAIQSIPSDRKGMVDVFFDKKDSFACLEIRDNGNGMTKDVRKNVFEPNFTTKTSGMGLGLAIVKNILIAGGGDISFKTVEGKGSSFYLTIPLMEE